MRGTQGARSTGEDLRCSRCEQVLFVSTPGRPLAGELLAAVVARHEELAHPVLPTPRQGQG
jgi:hypothetical protein